MLKNKISIAIVLAALVLTGAGCLSGGKDAGIARSLDGAKTFELKNAISGGGSLESRNVLRVAFNPLNTKQVLAGTQGAGFYFSQDQGESWQNVAFSAGNGNAMAIDSTNENILYLALDAKMYKSDDAGKNFREVYTEQSGAIQDVVIDPLNHNHIAAITSSGNFVTSNDAGETWKALSFIVGVPTRLAMDHKNPQKIYVGTQKSGLFISSDGGTTFSNIAFTNLQSTLKNQSGNLMQVNSVSIDPFDSKIVLVATNYGLAETTDAGQTFSVIPTLIIPESAPLRSVVFHPTIKNAIFLSASNKFYTSTDFGATWSVVELPTSREVYDIAVSPSNPNELYLAVKGTPKNSQPIDLIRFGQSQ